MKNKIYIGLVMLAVLTLAFTNISYADQAEQDQQKMMEAYMKMMAVTENHLYLKDFVGEWDVQTTAWMQPGMDPAITHGSGKAELIMGGRYLKLNFTGTMMGQPFEGLQIIGYDNLKEKYISFWIDNSGTAFYLTEGVRDKNVVTEMGEWPDPVTGGTQKVKMVTTLVSDDEYVLEMFMIIGAGEFKSLENRATRKK